MQHRQGKSEVSSKDRAFDFRFEAMMILTFPPLRTTLLSALCAVSFLSACGSQHDTAVANPSQNSGVATTTTGAIDPSAKQASGASSITTKPSDAIANLSNNLVTKEASIGAVTGFGSVIIEGVKYEDEAASVKLDIDPTQLSVGSLKDIKLGMRLAVQAEGKKAQSFTLGTEVIGKVTSLGADSFVIAGQTVKASSDASTTTVFEGVTGLSGLALGDFVEVYGQRDAAGTIIASRVERKNLGDKTFTRVSGNIVNLNKSSKTFAVGGLTISYANSLRVIPSVDALMDGSKVAVFSDVALQANVLNAKAIKVMAPSAELNGLLRIGGPIRSLDFTARSFMLDGIKVDASKASFVKGTASDLANALRVRVVGTFADGKIVASEVSFQRDLGDAQVDVKGEITDFVTAASFKVRGVPFNASSTVVSFVNGDVSKLVAGAVVRIKGTVEGDVVKAMTIEFLKAEAVLVPFGQFSIQGSLSNIDLAQKTIRVNGNTFNLPVGLADLAVLESLKNGSSISVEGTVDNGQILATKVVITKQ
jgi:Domain of unknown function (DUF5666)